MKRLQKYLLVSFIILMVGCASGGDSEKGSTIDTSTSSPTYAPPTMGNSQEENREEYAIIHENIFKDVKTSPLSTFSVDVDTASYSNIRRYIMVNKQLPPKDAVRTEEMLNYFTYNYKEPNSTEPFAINKYVGETIWNDDTKIIHIGIQTKKVDFKVLPASNLVFLLDVSGSMSAKNKLPLLKKSIKLLVDKLREKDSVSIVVYAGSSGLVLDKAKGNEKKKILDALNKLTAGGTTAGGKGIELAYKIALEGFIEEGNNRIILATDGDFNVGQSSQRDLETLIEEKRERGVYLTVLGFGMGNLKDNKMESLADKGNGNYAYIDSLLEAKKVLVTEMGSTLYTVAKDVKVQVDFNQNMVLSYRLIGYENRRLQNEDFENDKKDAGEIGMGHSVTVLYEIKPTSIGLSSDVTPSSYTTITDTNVTDEFATIRLRYKEPNSNISKLIKSPIKTNDKSIDSQDFKFAQSVTGFSMILRDSQFKNDLTIEKLIEVVKDAKGDDLEGYRQEFIELLGEAGSL